ncbi:MAG: YIP1 family protein [Candidatus Ranarchaeia archaeon]|jgi:hypothetical protein
MSNPKKCIKCGADLLPGAVYCSYCGAAVSQDLPPKTSQPIDTPASLPPSREPRTQPGISPPESELPLEKPSTPEAPIYAFREPVEPPLSFWQKIRGVFLKPEPTFKKIASKTDLIGPFFILLIQGLLLSIGLTFFYSNITFVGDMSSFLPPEFGLTPADLTAFLQAIMAPIMVVSSLFGVLFGFVVVGALYWIITKIAGGQGKFRDTLSVFGYASIPLWFSAIVTSIIYLTPLFFTFPPPTIDLSTFAVINTGLPPEFALVNDTMVIIMELYSAVLFAIGLQHVHKFSRNKALAVILIPYILIQAFLYLPLPLI